MTPEIVVLSVISLLLVAVGCMLMYLFKVYEFRIELKVRRIVRRQGCDTFIGTGAGGPKSTAN